jgi:hypothetical protein
MNGRQVKNEEWGNRLKAKGCRLQGRNGSGPKTLSLYVLTPYEEGKAN